MHTMFQVGQTLNLPLPKLSHRTVALRSRPSSVGTVGTTPFFSVTCRQSVVSTSTFPSFLLYFALCQRSSLSQFPVGVC